MIDHDSSFVLLRNQRQLQQPLHLESRHLEVGSPQNALPELTFAQFVLQGALRILLELQ
jgi:hypothetical protein